MNLQEKKEEIVKEFTKRFVDEVSLEADNTPVFRNRYLAGDVRDFLSTSLDQIATVAVEEEKIELRKRVLNYANKNFLNGIVIDPLELFEALTNKN